MINRVVLVGRLTKDIELTKTQSGLSVVSFTVAVNRRASKDSNDRQADFINCVAWRQTADFLGAYAKKGALIGVEGRIQTRHYDTPDGRRVYVTEVVCDSCQLLESRSVAENRAQQDSYREVNNDNMFEQFSTQMSPDEVNLDIATDDDLPF